MALRKNDPYNEMQSGHDGVRPGFLGGSDEGGMWGLFKSGEGTGTSRADRRAARIEAKAAKRDAASDFAQEDLASAEADASGEGFWRGGENLEEAESAEEKADGFYSGSGKDSGKKKLNAKKSKLTFLRRGGPSLGILGSVIILGGLMGGMQSLMPFAIEELLIEKFNSIGVSSTIASDAWLDMQLNYGVRKGNTINPQDPSNLYAFSHFQAQQFENQGIKVIEDVELAGSEGSDSITTLLYLKNNSYTPVVGSQFIGREGIVNAVGVASGLSNIAEPVSVNEALADPAFKVPYTTASKAWRGGGSGWFDNVMKKVTDVKLNLNRNRWASFVASGLQNSSRKFKEIADGNVKGRNLDDGVFARLFENETTEDNQTVSYSGEKQISSVGVADGGSRNVSQDSISSNDSSIGAVSDVLNSKAIKAASAVSNVACAFSEAMISIYTVVSAYQNLQFMNLVSGFLESVSKVKAGDGSESPMNEYVNNMSVEGETTDSEGRIVSKKSAMQSAGMAWLFSNSKISAMDQSVKNVNIENIMSNISGFVNDVNTWSKVVETCGYVKFANAAVGFTIDIVSLIPMVGGATKLIQLVIRQATSVAISAVLQVAISTLVSQVARGVVKMIIKNAATEWFGADLGNAIVSGGGKLLWGNAVSGGQGPASEPKLNAYLKKRDEVLADEASYQRAIRNPFDFTSKYTFLGSLAYNLIPLAYSGGNFISSMAKVSSLTQNSMLALAPTVSAIDAESFDSSKGSCELLETTGAVGDAFCNPYIITDTSTINYSPVAVSKIVREIGSDTSSLAANGLYQQIGSENFESDGYTIKEGSNLQRYVVYCGLRTSQYGIKDASVYKSITGSRDDDALAQIVSHIPIIGSVLDANEAVMSIENQTWINGSACVADPDNNEWTEELKYYQRYMENERLLENMNPGYSSAINSNDTDYAGSAGYRSPVTAYVEKYYEDNPPDQSLEGTLARFSGMTKSQVEDTLALIDYYEFLDRYDPTERLAFVKPKEAKELRFDNDNKIADFRYILLNQISYGDVRNRSFAI